jgi:hypothetical protein
LRKASARRKGYLHKYSIAESIEDKTTLPLYYNVAPNEMLVPTEVLEKEFLALAEAEGVSDIEELNKILERAVNLRNFLKGEERIKKVAAYAADHYRKNVEPLGYKAFLVAVDREACARYKKALLGLTSTPGRRRCRPLGTPRRSSRSCKQRRSRHRVEVMRKPGRSFAKTDVAAASAQLRSQDWSRRYPLSTSRSARPMT